MLLAGEAGKVSKGRWFRQNEWAKVIYWLHRERPSIEFIPELGGKKSLWGQKGNLWQGVQCTFTSRDFSRVWDRWGFRGWCRLKWHSPPYSTSLVTKGALGRKKGKCNSWLQNPMKQVGPGRGVKSQKVSALGRVTCSIKNRYKNSGFHSTCGVSDVSRYPKQLVVSLPHGGKHCLLILWPTLPLAQGLPISLACSSPQSEGTISMQFHLTTADTSQGSVGPCYQVSQRLPNSRSIYSI